MQPLTRALAFHEHRQPDPSRRPRRHLGRVVPDIGAAPALTVTFLIPVFGVLWGHVVLDEPVGWSTLAGGPIVIVGTALVTGFRFPTGLWRRRKDG